MRREFFTLNKKSNRNYDEWTETMQFRNRLLCTKNQKNFNGTDKWLIVVIFFNF